MKRERKPLFQFARFILRPLMWLLGVRITGREHYPKDTHAILLANHISALDPVPVAISYGLQDVHFLAKDALFKWKPMGWLFRIMHGIEVKRGDSDMAALRQCMQTLKDGHTLGIFPEGHRQKDPSFGKVQTGIGLIALKTDVPVIPIRIMGRYGLFSRVRVIIGPALDLSDLRAGRIDTNALNAVSERILATWVALAE